MILDWIIVQDELGVCRDAMSFYWVCLEASYRSIYELTGQHISSNKGIQFVTFYHTTNKLVLGALVRSVSQTRHVQKQHFS